MHVTCHVCVRRVWDGIQRMEWRGAHTHTCILSIQVIIVHITNLLIDTKRLGAWEAVMCHAYAAPLAAHAQ